MPHVARRSRGSGKKNHFQKNEYRRKEKNNVGLSRKIWLLYCFNAKKLVAVAGKRNGGVGGIGKDCSSLK